MEQTIMEGNLSQSSNNLNNISSAVSDLPYLNMGAGFLIGLSVGYVVKKSFKLMLFMLGVALILLFFLEYKNIVTINEDALLNSVEVVKNSFMHSVEFLKERVSGIKMISGTVSALVGFVIGIKMG
jgi:uncharacterized membrane protein (Fun14 family)